MSPLTRVACFLALVAAPVGCTITTYKDPEPAPRQAQEPARRPRPSTQEPTRQPGKRPVFRPGAGGGAVGGGGNTQRVTTPTVFGGAQAAAFRGLAYVIPQGTSKMPDFGALVPFALMFTDSFNVESQAFSSGFPGALDGQVEWFAIRYEGRFTVASDGAVEFKVVSDDGAILYVDGAKVVDNDGTHTVKPATGRATLKAGPHALRLDYYQATGPVALQVFMVSSGQDRLLVGTK